MSTTASSSLKTVPAVNPPKADQPTGTPPNAKPSAVDIAVKRLSAYFAKGDAEQGVPPMADDKAHRAAIGAVGLMLVDGLWLDTGWSFLDKTKMEFPLSPTVCVTLEFRGQPIQTDMDTLIKVLESLKATMPTSIGLDENGFIKKI